MKEGSPSSPFFFFAIFATLFLAIFDNTITNMAGLYIASDLGGSSETGVYPMVFFGLGSALSLPIAGAFSNRFGTIKCLSVALWIYTLFSILCGAASTFFLLNVFRFFMGYAAGSFYIFVRNV